MTEAAITSTGLDAPSPGTTEALSESEAERNVLAPAPLPAVAPFRPRYSPSWADIVNSRVERLRMPAWGFYALLALACLLAISIVHWLDGSYAFPTIYPFHAALACIDAYALALIHYTDDAAKKALDSFRPALTLDERGYEELRYRLTTMPALPTLLVTLGMTIPGIFNFALTMQYPEEARREMVGILWTSGTTMVPDTILYLTLWAGLALVVYHTIRQLNLVSNIHARHTRINLFRMAPIYAFSSLTARTSLALMLGVYATIALFPPGMREDPANLWLFISLMVLAAATFILPLIGVHGMLTRERARLLAGVRLRMEQCLGELHSSIDESDVRQTHRTTRIMEALLAEQRTLEGIATWPWHPETVQGLISAFLLPGLLFAIERVIRFLLGV